MALLAAQVACGPREPNAAAIELASPPQRSGELDPAALDRAIDAARGYLLDHLDARGRFTYVIRGDGSEPVDYNVLRHGGAVYALSQLEALRPDRRVAGAIVRAAAHLQRRYVGEGPGGASAVWSLPGEEVAGSERVAKLGGAGLGLVALTAAARLDPAAVPRKTLEGLGEMILRLQRADGSFVCKFWERRGADDSFVSLYYPGEAILGLVRLYRLAPDRRWLEAAGRGIRYLIDSRAEVADPKLPADHWVMIAMSELTALLSQRPELAAALPVSSGDMRRHALRLAHSMLRAQRRSGGATFTGDDRSTPTATRLEGLLALLRMLPPEHPAAAAIRAAVGRGVRFLLGCQVIAPGPRAGGILRRCPPGDAPRGAEIRVDYVQHALSAFIGARRLLAGPGHATMPP